MKEQIEFAEFLEIEKKLEIKVGTVISVEDVPKSSKLIKLDVKFEDYSTVVVTNIKPHLGTLSLVGLSFLFVTNLKPSKMMGIESHAMILPGEIEKGNLIHIEGTGISAPFQLSGTKIL